MAHLLSPYWAVMHRRPEDYKFFLDLQPPVVKIMDGGRPDFEWIYKNLPNAIVIARFWAIDDNHGQVWKDTLKDPEGAGKRVARQMVAKAKELGLDPKRTLLMGPQNEPKVWEPGGLDAAVKSSVAFADELTLLGWMGLVLNLSVGWPANSDTATVKDTPVNWLPYAPIEDAIKRGKHMLGLHEYWPETGVAQGWGWLAGRALKCPWDVPIVIGECGMSYAVTRSGIPTVEQGWRQHISDEVYAAQIVDYHNRMAADSRVKGLCLFLCDFANPEWWSKDVQPAYDNIIARKGQLKPVATTPHPPAPKPPVVDPPVIIQPPGAPKTGFRFPLDELVVTQWWSRTHGGIDYSCVVGTPVKACADGEVAYVADDRDTEAANGGYGKYIRVWHPQLRIHTFYAHLDVQRVKRGDKVTLGQVIGLSGNTGNSTGPHLHFEVRLATATGAYDKPAAGNTYNARIDPVAFVEGMLRT